MTPPEPRTLSLSQTEGRVLDLYNKLRELRLELALLKARQEHTPGGSEGKEADMDDLQLRVLEAKASIGLCDDVIDNVVMVQPILKAVHNATHASPVERDLLPFIQRRELINTEAARQYSEIESTTKLLVELELEGYQISHQNTELAKEVLQLAESVQGQNGGSPNSAQPRGELEGLEQQVKVSRQRWKVMKGVVSAIVAGSGMDWSRDKRLREMVLEHRE